MIIQFIFSHLIHLVYITLAHIQPAKKSSKLFYLDIDCSLYLCLSVSVFLSFLGASLLLHFPPLPVQFMYTWFFPFTAAALDFLPFFLVYKSPPFLLFLFLTHRSREFRCQREVASFSCSPLIVATLDLFYIGNTGVCKVAVYHMH